MQHKATGQRLRDIRVLPTMYKQTQEAVKMRNKKRKERKLTQVKEYKKYHEIRVNEMEATNQLETEFKTLLIRMPQELSQNSNKEIVNIKKNIEIIK